jgi:hypothetical protein
MKYTAIYLLLFWFSAANVLAQTETFDLATYTAPNGWKKSGNTPNVISYAITNNQKGTYAQIGIYASTNSKGNLQADFESEWQELIVKTYKPTKKPELIPTASENGWDAQGGGAPFEFNGGQSAAMLITMSGYGRCMSIVILTNTDEFQSVIEKFLESVDLKKIETTSQPALVNGNNSIVGAWGKAASPNQKYDDYKRPYSANDNGYQKDQYTFNSNGTYNFVSKTFRMTFDKILLVRENGTYQINGKNLTISPQKSVIEAWSKKDGADKWGNLLNTQNRPLEKVTYQFTKHYFEGIQQWNLVLQADKETQRDGTFSSNTTFNNAWYFSTISNTNTAIELPGNTVVQKTPASTAKPAVTSSYHFSTTNFDDGWTSTVQEDWVEVVKKNVKVLIHYPNEAADRYNSDLLDGLKNAWNVLVAPKYSSASNFEFKPIQSWQSIGFAEADVVEKSTGKNLHVVLFKMNYSNGSGKYLEFITPDKKSFEQEFGLYHTTTDGWEKMERMANYNKFAVALSDLNGKWTNNFTGMTQYVNAYTGADAGASSHASSELFQFSGDTYHWELAVASGMVGNIKFQNAKSDGKLTVPNSWQIHFSDLEGKPKTYNAFFSCVKGARILWLEDSAYASGYSGYGKKE